MLNFWKVVSLKRSTIPSHDELGREIEMGDVVTIFSKHGTNYTGKMVMRPNGLCLEICEGTWLSGIGNLRIIKDDRNG